ncbi:hypothetical protein PVK06_030889 [Gossypium arboreum]|uniref:Uncharacterized protein n=1 Tax=Gossypium arboreum TaxID=29729 RepID=A0ABR0NQI7_GOSAR|nr:hypothetical protein PVK06_030889 [Gossypium arboreum]
MLLCQQKGIVPHDDQEILENKGPINKTSIERMTHVKDTLTMKEAETSKTIKGKTTVESKGTNLTTEKSLLRKMKDIEKLANSINNKHIRLVATIKDMDRSQNLFYAYTRAYNSYIKEEDSREVEEFLRRIDSLVECDFIDGKETLTVEVEVFLEEEDVRVEIVIEKAKEENTKTEAAEKEFVEDIVNASEFLDGTKDNLEQDRARPMEATEVISEEHHNLLVIVFYTEPFKVTPPTQEATDDASAEQELEEQFKDRTKPKENKRKHSKDKKCKKEEEEETSCSHIDD